MNSVILPAAKIAEFYTVDIKKLVAEFSDRCYKSEPARNPAVRDECRLKVIQDPLYERLKSTVDLELAVNSYNIYRSVRIVDIRIIVWLQSSLIQYTYIQLSTISLPIINITQIHFTISLASKSL